MKKHKLESALDNMSKVGEKSGGFLGWIIKHIGIIIASIFIFIFIGGTIFIKCFGRGLTNKILNKEDAHLFI